MAACSACSDVPTIPGLVVGSVLLLVLSSNPAWGNYNTQRNDSNATSTAVPNSTTVTTDTPDTTDTPSVNIVAIVVPVVVGVVAIVAAVLLWLFCVVKKKRQTEGTYRPSAEEQSGTRSVTTPDALKLPKEERLI